LQWTPTAARLIEALRFMVENLKVNARQGTVALFNITQHKTYIEINF